MKKIILSVVALSLCVVSYSQPWRMPKPKPTVYYTKDITPESLVRIYEVLNAEPTGHVAVKISTGESGNNNYLKPELIKNLVEKVNGTIVECNTAYKGSRQDVKEHWKTIHEHGFDNEFAVDIMDQYGEMRIPVKDKKHIKYDVVGDHLANYDFMINLAHFKGHAMGGFGGVLKNASIGIASTNGKAYIHSAGKTEEPETAWKNLPEQDAFIESMAAAAQAVHTYMDGKVLYINIMNNMSVDCDCDAHPAAPQLKDMGIVASLDPVAADQACLDMVFNHKASEGDNEKPLIERINRQHGTYITEYAEKIGLGSREYKLVDIDEVFSGLADAYKDYFNVGVALNSRNIIEPRQVALVKANFNSITAENCMKPISVHPRRGVWNWDEADRLANFCRENGIKLRGHCLCWHSQFSDWMFTRDNGEPATKEEFYAELRDHIHTVVNRYKDIVYAWDVVNEAMTDDENAEIPYRQSRHWKLCGDEFIAKAFEFAHEADPNAILMYNDYNAAIPHKRDKIYNMVKKMQEAGVPINGIGMQGHYNIYEPSEEDFEAAIVKYSELVKHIHITELDVRVNKEMGGQLQFSREGAKVDDRIKRMQERQYSMLFRVMRKHKDVIDVVTFWNLSDRDSWLGERNYPLPIDVHYLAKDLFYVLRDWDKQPERPFFPMW